MTNRTLLETQARHLIEERIATRRRPSGVRRRHRLVRWIGGR
jgi:hypothetical protein